MSFNIENILAKTSSLNVKLDGDSNNFEIPRLQLESDNNDFSIPDLSSLSQEKNTNTSISDSQQLNSNTIFSTSQHTNTTPFMTNLPSTSNVNSDFIPINLENTNLNIPSLNTNVKPIVSSNSIPVPELTSNFEDFTIYQQTKDNYQSIPLNVIKKNHKARYILCNILSQVPNTRILFENVSLFKHLTLYPDQSNFIDLSKANFNTVMKRQLEYYTNKISTLESKNLNQNNPNNGIELIKEILNLQTKYYNDFTVNVTQTNIANSNFDFKTYKIPKVNIPVNALKQKTTFYIDLISKIAEKLKNVTFKIAELSSQAANVSAKIEKVKLQILMNKK